MIMFPYFPLHTAFWPYLYPVGLLPWSESSDHITLCTKTHIPGATTTQCGYVTNIHYLNVFQYSNTHLHFFHMHYCRDILV